MAKANVWPAVHEERRALADDLAGLTEAQWETHTLSTDWTVRDTVAHLTSAAKMTPPTFFAKFVASGFKLTKLQAKDIAVERGSSSADALDRFRGVLDSSTHPPGPNETWLGEVLVHAEDIRRPLRIGHSYPVDGAVQVADFYKGSNLVLGTKSRISGLRVRATDADWSCGDGPEVAGPVMVLLLAMTGRKQVLGELSGEGVATLQTRP